MTKSLGFLILLFIMISVSASCGKKAHSKKPPRFMAQEEIVFDEEVLNKQDVSCELNQSCPNYIAKVVLKNGNSLKFCTGFLTSEDTIATSTSCLPEYIRLNGLDCSKDVFIFFPKTSNREAERLGCVKVRQVSDLEGNDPIYWRDDVSFLQLSKSIPYRKQVQFDRISGLANNNTHIVWMVDQQDQYSAIVRKVTCDTVHRSYVNPLSLNEFSPNVLLAGCKFTNGASGAPIFEKGKVVGMISSPMSAELRRFILEEIKILENGLRDMVHASNFACAPTPNETTIQDEECLKNLTETEVARYRNEMMSTGLVFNQLKKDYEDHINRNSKIFRLGVKIIPKDGLQLTQIYLKCFRPSSDWLPTVGSARNYTEKLKIPVRTFKKVMDSNARVVGKFTDIPNKTLNLKFSVKDFKDERKSSVTFWFDDGEETRVPKLSEDCPL